MIDERLKYVADCITGDKMADIGSDHAYLPIYAVKNGLVDEAICGEVVPGPYESTVRNINAHGMMDRIDARLGDGLNILSGEDRVDTVTICGMGGPLIAAILNDGFANVEGRPRLVLQANNYPYPVRQAVTDLNYRIVHEKVLKMGKHYYEVIVCDYNGDKIDLTLEELILGPVNLIERDSAFLEKTEWEYDHQKKIYHNINKGNDTGKIEKVRSNMELMERVLKDEH